MIGNRCRAAFLAQLGLIILGAAGCGSSEGPELELERLIADAEAAAEARDTGHFRGLISHDYLDTRGNTRDDLIGWLRAYFLTHGKVEVVVRVEAMDIRRNEAATVALGVLSLGVGGGRFAGLAGDIERIEVELVRERGEWRIIGASWR